MNSGAHNPYRIEALSDQHDRSTFFCGVEALDRYWRQQVGQEARRKITAPFVLIHGETGIIAGFYTLANTAIDVELLPSEWSRKLPRYPLIPATLLGRLAVGERHRGIGLGELLLLDALHRSLTASEEVASFAVVMQAKDTVAAAFYMRYGFLQFTDASHRLFLPMETIGRLFH